MIFPSESWTAQRALAFGNWRFLCKAIKNQIALDAQNLNDSLRGKTSSCNIWSVVIGIKACSRWDCIHPNNEIRPYSTWQGSVYTLPYYVNWSTGEIIRCDLNGNELLKYDCSSLVACFWSQPVTCDAWSVHDVLYRQPGTGQACASAAENPALREETPLYRVKNKAFKISWSSDKVPTEFLCLKLNGTGPQI